MADELTEDGLIVAGVNTTKDVGIEELVKQGRKLGFDLTPYGDAPRARSDGKFTSIYDALVNS